MKKYTLYENRSYLIKFIDDVPEDQLHIYGEIECQMWDNYPDCDPKPKGYVLKRGIHKFYAFIKREK